MNASLSAIEGIDALVKQLKGVVTASVAQTSSSELQQAAKSFQTIGNQINQLIEDSSYQGLNLLSSDSSTLTVQFSARTASKLEIGGLDLNSTQATTGNVLFSVAAFSAAGAFFSDAFGLSAGSFTTAYGAGNVNAKTASDAAITILDKGVERLRGHAATLGSNVAVLQTRLDFTSSYVNELNVGSDKLTLADLNEEGANLVALQTRQQLGIQALSVSGQQQQAVLRLIG